MAGDIAVLSDAQNQRRLRRAESSHPQLWDLLDEVTDPEIPVVSLWDLGVLQNIAVEGDKIRVEITPTYSGCPAMVEMAQFIVERLNQAGYSEVEVKTLLAPTWTTEMMTAEGKQKLRDYGISPPRGRPGADEVECPQCGSKQVSQISEFGSTACKALYRCNDCLEPFDHFKCI